MKTLHSEIIDGYRLLEPLPPAGPGELWSASAPDGGMKTIRLLPGSARDRLALERLRAFEHPALVPLERVEFHHNELVMVRESIDHTLATRLRDYRSLGRPALPRAEALAYLREVAEVLDLLAQTFAVQHLALCPQAIALSQHHARVVDFGLAHCLAQRPGGPVEARELRAFASPYAAPELAQGEITLACDQFSLAVTYYEAVVGWPPSLTNHLDVNDLPAQDRSATARALDPDPDRRFPSSGAFIQALLTADTRGVRRIPNGSGGLAREARSRSRRPSSRIAVTPVEQAAAPAAAHGPAASSPAASGPTDNETDRPRASATSSNANETGLPGYRLLDCLERNALGELWKSETLAGSQRLVRLLFDIQSTAHRAGGSLQECFQALNHDVLAPTIYLPAGVDRLAVVSDPGKLSLAGRFRRCQADSLPGIPRHELLDCLRLIAEGLDDLAAQSGLQHLCLTARQIYVGNGPPRLVDFGLAEILWLPAGRQTMALDARCTPPELLHGQVTRAADQYSLAVLFQELLTGSHPFRQLSAADLLTARRPAPNLSMLSSTDQLAVVRALHLDPDKRFPTCRELVAALEGMPQPLRAAAKSAAAKVMTPPPSRSRSLQATNRLTPTQLVSALVQAAAGTVELREFRGVRFLLRPGESIEHRCFARLAPATALLKLESFRQRWQATTSSIAADHVQLFLPAPAIWWQRLLGQAPGLEVHIRLAQTSAATGLTELAIDIFPVDHHPDRGGKLLTEMGPLVLESARHFLQAHRERRGQERLPFAHAVQVCPMFPNLTSGVPIEAQARDISLHGMGLTLPRGVQTTQVAIRLAPTPEAELISVPARIVHASPLGNGQVEIGINFATPQSARSTSARV